MRKLTLAQIQEQTAMASATVNRFTESDQYMLVTNARIDTHKNQLLCVFMDRKEKAFIERSYDTEALLTKYDYINKSVVTGVCHKSLVDVMAQGNMFIYRNVDEPFVIFNNGPDDVLIVPFETMVKYTMDVYGPEPVLQVTQRGFTGVRNQYATDSTVVSRIADHLHSLTPTPVKPTKFNAQYVRIAKVTPFKNKVRVNFKSKGVNEVRELDNGDITNSLWKLFGGNGGEVGGKLRRLVKHKATMDKSKLYVIYSDDVMIGGIVSFIEGRSVVNGYVSEALIIKYIKRFMEADLLGNIVNIETK